MGGKTLEKTENGCDLPPKEEWPPVEIFGPEQFKDCSEKHGRMRYVGVRYYGEEPEQDLHMWCCEKCGEIAEEPATLTERGKEMLAERFPHEKPPPAYEVQKR